MPPAGPASGARSLALAARHLSRRYRQGSQIVDAVRDVSLELAPGEIGCVLGRSGSGKSTLLHLLGCLERPDAGEIWIDGAEVTRMSDRARVQVRRRHLGFVFQSFNLIDHLTALENVALPLRYAGVAREERRRRARQALERMGLGARTTFRPHQLSGGEQQRVALARALTGTPRLILADEPTGELDSVTAHEMAELFREINRETGATFFIATHDAALAAMAGRVFEMRDGEIFDM